MNLREALVALAVERLNSTAYFYGIALPDSQDPDYQAKLAELISKHLLIPANVLVAMNGLSDEEILALRMITIAGGGNGVIVEQCHQKLNQLSRKWRRNGFKVIEGLITRGLVFTRREGYRQVYFVPKDLREVLSDFFLSAIFQRTSIDPAHFSPRYRFDFAAPLRHVCLLMSYLRKHEVRVTQAGSMFKKCQDDLVVIIEEDENSLDESFFPVRYPPRLAFLLFFAKSHSLCEERSSTLRLGSEAEKWLDAPYSHWRKTLYTYWKQTFIEQDSDLQTLLWLIEKSPEDTVLSVSALLDEMNALSTSHSSHGLNLRIEKNLVDMLEYLGALEVYESRNDIMIRVTRTGRALFGLEPWPEEKFDTDIYVQPNFEALVPCTIEPRILWSIDTFAEIIKVDQMLVYKLSRDSVYRAMLHGHTPDTIEEFLAEHSRIPIPQNVSYSISQWGTSYGRIEFEDVILLKCDSKELADELMLSPRIKPYLKKKVGPCYIVVDRESYQSLVAALSEEGYMPKVKPSTRVATEQSII
ncbi:MAG TPA: hypothetical protein GXZ88_03855 [Firmicutes bacterium]|nr:hypothetical protein [Candidatus Fermentithermobacillaceae bacterium]